MLRQEFHSTSTDSELLEAGSSVTYSFNPDAGYQIAQIIVNGEVVPKADSYAISNIDKSYTIKAIFTKDGQTVVTSQSSVVKQTSLVVGNGSRSGFSSLFLQRECTRSLSTH